MWFFLLALASLQAGTSGTPVLPTLEDAVRLERALLTKLADGTVTKGDDPFVSGTVRGDANLVLGDYVRALSCYVDALRLRFDDSVALRITYCSSLGGAPSTTASLLAKLHKKGQSGTFNYLPCMPTSGLKSPQWVKSRRAWLER